MKQKTGRKLLDVLLALALVLSLLPGMSLTAMAWDGDPYAGLVPTGSEETDALTAKQVTFNGKKWYVIKNESTSATEGTLTLLYAGSLGKVKFDENGSNVYANSSIKTALGNLTTEDGYYYPVAEAIKDTANGKLYLLSEEEAYQVPQNVRKEFDSAAWWLRTQAADNKVKYVFVQDTVQNNPGRIVDIGVNPTTSGVGVRPALQLDLSKVVYDATNKAFYIPATAPTNVTVTGATLVAGYGAGSVSVTATAADGHTLSYQWYQSTTNSNQDGTMIDGANSAIYNIPTGNTAGDYYYYCVVTSTRKDNSQTASATSGVAVVTVAADTDELVAKLAEEKNIDLSDYYLIPAEDMYFTSKEYWIKGTARDRISGGADEYRVGTKQFTKQGLPKDSLVFCKAYYAFETVAWNESSSSAKTETVGKSYNLLTKISDQFDWWDTYSLFGFNLTKYAEGDFNTKVEADLSSISDAFRIYVPKPADAAEVSGTKYPTVADAIRAAGSGATVTLLKDTVENVALKSGKNVVLDLNGHKLTNDGRHSTIVAQTGSTLVVTGNGTVDNTANQCAPLFNNGGTVTLNGGTFTRSLESGKEGGNTYYTVVNRGTMTINEGVTVSNDNPSYNYSSLIANGYNELTRTGYREIDPNISFGYVEGESAANPTLTITGGTFKGGNQTLKNDVNGVARISGGEFSSTTGNAIKNLSELTISGGTFTAQAEGKFALQSATESGKTYGPESASGTATVTGGTFIGKLQEDEGATIEVSGGEFSEPVPENCCAEGYRPTPTPNGNSKYSVHPHSFTYSVNGATITANCSANDCYLTEKKIAFTIVKPTLTVYDQKGDSIKAEATLDGIDEFNTETGLNVAPTAIQYFNATKNEETYTKGASLSVAPTDAGDYMAEITLSDVKTGTATTGNVTASVGYTIAKADPTANAPTGLTATYGDTLADVSLEGKNPQGNTEGSWAWVDSTQSVGNVVSPAATFQANFTPTDEANYKTAENVEVTVTVSKADPAAPTGLTATYGQTLANVTLPDGWTWADSTQSVGNVVDPAATFKANFAGDDNHNAASNVDVSVTVSKASLTVTASDNTISYGKAPSANGVTYEGFQGDDNESSLGGKLKYDFGYEKNGKPGTYKDAIIPTGLESDNYDITFVAGDLVVEPVVKTVMAKATASGKKNLKFSWNKVTGAVKYEVWMAKCGKKNAVKKVKTLKASKLTWTKKGLKKNTAYKFYVIAKDANGKQIGKSRLCHVLTSNQKGKYTNAKSLTLKSNTANLKVGRTFKISATQEKAVKSKYLLKHAALLRYRTANSKVATVDENGVIKAVGPGWCTVYVQTVNGIWKAVDVTVEKESDPT